MNLEALVRNLSEAASHSAPSEAERDAAKHTGGVPVSAQFGGVLVLRPDGTVTLYDPETRTLSEPEPQWWTAARVKAARRFPELAGILPAKPMNAVQCPQWTETA